MSGRWPALKQIAFHRIRNKRDGQSLPLGTTRDQNFFRREAKIPVHYPGDYHTLIEAARKSKFEPYYLNVSCPKEQCVSQKRLRLTPWLVDRNCVLFDSDNVACYEQTPVPLCVCEQCHCRIRVLPVEILPGKTFSLPIIETACHRYGVSADGLRKTVKTILGVAPHFSTLHGWLGGIGERAMDKVQLKQDKAAIGQPSLPPTSAVVAETAKRKDLELIKCWNNTKPAIGFWKYKSLFRKELLQSCIKLLQIAGWLFQISPYPLTTWQQWLIPIFEVPAWLFASRNLLTPIQLTDLTNSVVKSDFKKTPLRGPP